VPPRRGLPRGRQPILENADVRIRVASVAQPMPYLFRNADADEVLFVHDGAGRLETDFGPLSYEPGDYLLVPRGTMFRLAPSSPTKLLVVEAVLRGRASPIGACSGSTRCSIPR
jgi:homogentisate 1,2-dioxygenase